MESVCLNEVWLLVLLEDEPVLEELDDDDEEEGPLLEDDDEDEPEEPLVVVDAEVVALDVFGVLDDELDDKLLLVFDELEVDCVDRA
jgi:hypothetical protein